VASRTRPQTSWQLPLSPGKPCRSCQQGLRPTEDPLAAHSPGIPHAAATGDDGTLARGRLWGFRHALSREQLPSSAEAAKKMLI